MTDITDAGPRLTAMNDALERNRLRLTDAEREAVERAADLIDNKTCGDSSTLRGLLERFSQFGIRESDRSQPIANCDSREIKPLYHKEIAAHMQNHTRNVSFLIRLGRIPIWV